MRGRRSSCGSSLFSVEFLEVSLTPRFSGVEAGWRGILTALAVSQPLEPSAAHRETAKAVDGNPLRHFTPLKRGVNERGPCPQSTSIPPETARNPSCAQNPLNHSDLTGLSNVPGEVAA